MSATLMGAAMTRGPATTAPRFALVAIADNADDYGFANLSIETIALKTCCTPRNAMRLVQGLEKEGWITVRRRVLGGKGSVYFISLAKLQVEEHPRMRKSPMHLELDARQKSRDNLSPKYKLKSRDNLSPENRVFEKSGDNGDMSQVTMATESGDNGDIPFNSINRCEPLSNQKTTTPAPTAREVVSATPEPKPPDRFNQVRTSVQEHQRHALGGLTIWPPAADRSLASMLNTYGEREWPADRLVQCVHARFASEEDPARPPQEWIGTLPRYISGPKDRYRQLAPASKKSSHLPNSDFAQVVSRELEYSKTIMPMPPQARDAFFNLMRHEVSPLVFTTWIKPLKLAVAKRGNTPVILAPNTEWVGMQEKYLQKIKSVFRQCGLTVEHELWYLNKSGKWTSKDSSAAA